MSEYNGDRARFHKDRKRRLRLRQRTARLRLTLQGATRMGATPAETAPRTLGPALRNTRSDEGGGQSPAGPRS